MVLLNLDYLINSTLFPTNIVISQNLRDLLIWERHFYYPYVNAVNTRGRSRFSLIIMSLCTAYPIVLCLFG